MADSGVGTPSCNGMLRDGDPAESTLLASGTFSNDRGTEILLCVADNVLISPQGGGKARIYGCRGIVDVDRSVPREPVLLGSSRRGGGKLTLLGKVSERRSAAVKLEVPPSATMKS